MLEPSDTAAPGNDDGSNLFTSPQWEQVIAATYGFQFHGVKAAGKTERFALVEDALGARMVAPAFGDFAARRADGGIMARIDAAREAFPHASFTIKLAGETGLPADRCVRDAIHNEIDLGPDGRQAERRFRRKAQQAREAGVTVHEVTDVEGFARFYQLYARQRVRKFASLPQPFAFFERIAEVFFPDNGFILEARHEGRVIGGVAAIEYGGECYSKFSASDPDALDLRPNNLLMNDLIEHSRKRGSTRLDMGLTPREGGLARFKQAMGASEQPLRTYRWPALDGPEGDVGAMRALLSETTAALVATDPEPQVASDMGQAFYRYFV